MITTLYYIIYGRWLYILYLETLIFDKKKEMTIDIEIDGDDFKIRADIIVNLFNFSIFSTYIHDNRSV